MTSRIGKNKSLGFTLIELIFVITILITLVGATAPLFKRSFEGLQMENSCSEIIKVLEVARSQAITESVSYGVEFDEEKNRYQLILFSKNLKDAKRPSLSEPQGRPHQLPKGIALRASEDRVAFYPNGTCSPIEIVLTTEREEWTLKANTTLGQVRMSHEDQK